jgi:hypothetical protein
MPINDRCHQKYSICNYAPVHKVHSPAQTSIMIRSYDHANNPLRSDAFSLVMYIHRNHPVISSRP